MKLINIPPQKLISGAYALWEDQWLLLTSGDFEEKRFNAMTVSWGSLGVMEPTLCSGGGAPHAVHI